MNLVRPLLATLLATAAAVSAAQGTASPAKKELAQRIVQAQQAAVEGVARGLAEQSIAPLAQQAMGVLQSRIPAEQREAVARDIQAEFKKYGDEVVPMLRERALKLAPTTIGAVLEEKFSEDELKVLANAMESAAFRKYQQIAPELQKSLVDKLVADARPVLEPKMQALRDVVGKRLGAAGATGSSSSPAPKAAASAPKAAASAPRR